MKIISSPPNFKEFKATCKRCDAELMIEEEDVQYYYFSDQREGTSEYFFFNCAVCDAQNSVNESNVPLVMRNRLKKTKRGF